ncbi:MAG: SRPBCC family protein [Acidimicrobiales bacterium]
MDQVSTHIDAPPGRVWDLVTDVTRMGEWSPECTGCEWNDDAGGPTVGARFKGHNRHGLVRWTTRCEVSVADAPSHFAFDVEQSGARWGYRFEADDGGTRLTEYREQRRPKRWWVRPVYAFRLLGWDRERIVVDGMQQTVDRIKAAAER